MSIPKRVGLLALALASSTLGWVAFGLGDAGTSSDYRAAEMLGTALLFLAAGYQLLALALALRGFDRFEYLQGNRLLAATSVACFFAVPLLGIIFELGESMALLTLAACLLAALPWLLAGEDKGVETEPESAPEPR